MKKKFTKITSCLLCLAMLLSMAGPAMAAFAENNVLFEDILDGDEIVFSPDSSDDAISIDAPDAGESDSSSAASLPGSTEVSPFAATGEYEIYPTPHSVSYGTGTVTLPTTMQVTYGDGIDEYTVARAEEAFAEAGVTLSEEESSSVTLNVRIKGASETVTTTTTNLFDKYDAYKLTIDASGVTVIGKDTDAAFYGLTTVKRILQQVEDQQVKHITVEDYADVPFRGFIEGYYGNPWTTEDRVALMKFGGEIKQNIYFYAPKDDPKHNAKWRELYTQEELREKIQPLAEAGNESKCYFGFALHPFMSNPIRFDSEANYQADLAVLKEKFEQAMSVGVRQIAVLADDAFVPTGGAASYVKLMTDLTEWVSSAEMQARYPGLKTSIPFCPENYGGNGSSAQLQTLKQLPASVPVIMTGGQVWGHVEHNFLNTYYNNMQNGPFLWVNWPCTDNSKNVLTMGGHGSVLHSDLTATDVANLKGIMLNPMQQSEPSKAGIFFNADYSWNIWNGSDSAQRISDVWDASFKYVDHDSALETQESVALRELSKHMIHQYKRTQGSYDKYYESVELQPELTAFQEKLDAGTLTAGDVAAMREEFQTLHDAAVLYKGKTTGNTRILGVRNDDGSYPTAQEQMAPWLDTWVEFTDATLELLDALAASLDNEDGHNDKEIAAKYISGQSKLADSQTHNFWYVDHYENAIVGAQRLVPFTSALQASVAEVVMGLLSSEPEVATGKLTGSVIRTALWATSGANNQESNLIDGNDSTYAYYDPDGNGNNINSDNSMVGDYIGLDLGRVVKNVGRVRFVVGNGSSDDKWTNFKLQYSTDGKSWTDVKEYVSTNRQDIIDENLGGVEARYIRFVNTVQIKKWLFFGELSVWADKVGPETETFSGTISISDNMASKGGALTNATDGNNSTYVHLAEYPYKAEGAPGDSIPPGAWVQLDLGSSAAVGRISILQDGTDRLYDAVLEYSTDGTAWTPIATGLNAAQITQDVDITARYIRFRNGTNYTTKWFKLFEFTVYGPVNYYPVIAYQSDTVKNLTNPVGELTDDSATLAADSVMLRPGEFVGIALPRIRSIIEIIADYTPAPGLVLKVGMNEAEMTTISTASTRSISGGAQLMAADTTVDFTGSARYIRLENEGDQTVTFQLHELSVQSDEVQGIHYVESMSNMGLDGTYGNQDNRTSLNFFDGNLGTVTTLANSQIAGEYVTYDLGQLRPIKKLTMAMSESLQNYLRHGVLEVSPTGADNTWTTILEVNNDGAFSASVADGASGDPSFRRGVPQQNYVSFVGEVEQAVQARYLRIRVTAAGGSGRFIAASEILINTESMNNMEYVPASNDPTFVASPFEVSADYSPDKMRDSNLTTSFRPNMTGLTSGSLIYRLSDMTSIGQINIVEGTASNTTVSVRPVGKTNFEDIGTLEGGLNQIPVPEDIVGVAEIKLSWGNVTPNFYELITIPREASIVSGGVAASAPVGTVISDYVQENGVRTYLFDENWRFNLGDTSGASSRIYDDSAWRLVDLPHDYSIEGEYTSSGEAESGYLIGGTGWYRKTFTLDPSWANKVITINFGGVYMDSEIYLNGTKLGENHYGYNPFAFVLPSNLLTFEGENVIAVKTDDAFPSSRWYSGAGIYRSVNLTVTDPIHVAQYGTKVTTTNTGTVTVKTKVQNSGTTSATNVTVEQAIYELNSSYVKGATPVVSAAGTAANPAANSTTEVTQTLTVSNPKIWNTWDKGTPNLYVLVTTVKKGQTVVDTYETEFGFRTAQFTLNDGFKLNGENLKLKGVCMHHDQGALGAEAWYRALERQVDILKDMGVNAIRVTHNPAADELIEICNRKGILIIDEFFDGWHRAKNGNTGDFARWFSVQVASDNSVVNGSGKTWAQFVVETIVNRDKNAPCVIMYSMGNELTEGAGWDNNYATNAANIISWAKAIDDTRPLTYGQNGNNVQNLKSAVADKIHAAGGVIGINYYNGFDSATAHNSYGWLIYASETASHVNSRGVYNVKRSTEMNSDKLLTSYDKSNVGWGATASESWWRVIQYDYNAGEFIWTGFDYIGEPTPNNGTDAGWKNGENSPKNSFFGAIDTNGLPKDNYWLYRSMWNESDYTLHVLPTWDERDLVTSGANKTVEVVVYSNAPVIRVYLNDVEVGAAQTNETITDAGHKYRTFATTPLQGGGTNTFSAGSGSSALYATFNIPYQSGKLEVKAFERDGSPITNTEGRSVVQTTDATHHLDLDADNKNIKNDGRDLSYVTISVMDSKNEIVNGARDDITVTVTGAGKLVGLDNGVQPDHTSFLANHRTAGAGQLVAIIQSDKVNGGEITVTASANGMETQSITLNTAGQSYNDNDPVSYEISKLVYVQRGTDPELPETADVILRDGTRVSDQPVEWADYDLSDLNTVGSTVAIDGTIQYQNGENIRITIGVIVMDEVAAVLNYSTVVRVGQAPVLPATRPAVMADGTVVPAQFPVEWNDVDPSSYAQAGTFVVNGTADVFGETYRVTATIRVTTGTIVEGGNVASVVQRPAVNDVSNEDLLKAFDGNPSTSWTGSGKALVEFDTQQNLYRIVLTYSGAAPTAGVTLTLENGPVNVRPTISGNTATYELGDINASVTFTMTFTNQVTLVDVQLIVGTPVFDVYSKATLDDLKLSGQSVSAAELASKNIKTPAANVVVSPITNNNAAITILPENSDGVIVIVTEAEDHSGYAVYTIQLNAPEEITGADDDSMDYPREKTTATAPSQHGANNGATEGPASFAVDGNTTSFWSSRWSATDNATGTAGNSEGPGDLTNLPEQRYIQLTLEEPTLLTALRYLPRDNIQNGTVLGYEVRVSTDGTNFTKVSEGTWQRVKGWKLAEFNEPVTAKYVRLYGTNTYSEIGTNKLMSCAELRVVRAPADAVDLSMATMTVTPNEFAYMNRDICPGTTDEATVTVTLVSGETLVEGRDYELDYENNVEPGIAYIYARAIAGSGYKGAAVATFTITKTDQKITSFESITVRVHPGIDPTPDLPSSILAYTNQGDPMMVDVIWDSVPTTVYVYPKIKTYTLLGRLRDASLLSDPTLKPALTLNIAWSQSADPISMVTAVGVVPVLPSTVTVRFDDGTSAQRDVTWDLSNVNFNTPGIVTVTGNITGIDRVDAKASIRVVEPTASDTNIAANDSNKTYEGEDNPANSLALKSIDSIFPMALSYWSSGNNNPYQAIKTTTDSRHDVYNRWSDWEKNTSHPSTWMGVAFETSTANVTAKEGQILTLVPHIVNKVKVMFVDESGGTTGAVTFPKTYKIQYYTGPVANLSFDTRTTYGGDAFGNGRVRSWTGSPLLDDDNWSDVVVTGDQPAVPNSNGQMLEIPFTPVSTAIIRVLCTPKASDKWVGVQSLEVYGMTVNAHSNFTVTSVQLGGVEKKSEFKDGTLPDGTPAKVLEVSLAQGEEIPMLAVTADNNASVSITQASLVPGSAEAGSAWAQAVITSEDGSKTETYVVKFSREGAAAAYFIEKNIPAASQGKITFSADGGAPNTEITVTAAPGYELTISVQILDGPRAGETIPVSGGKFRMPAANVRVTASVTAIRYSISYLLNGGTVAANNPNTYTVESADITLRNPTKAGYTFQGWIGSGLTEPTNPVIIRKGSIGDRIYTAMWETNSNVGGGGGSNTGGGSSGGGSTGGGGGSFAPVGDVIVTTTDPKTGNVTTTTTTRSGLVTTVTETPDGKQSAVVLVPENSPSNVNAVMPALDVTGGKTPDLKVQNNTSRPVSVTVPIIGGDTVVAVRVAPDGSETVVPYSMVDENGLRIKLEPGDENFYLKDNKKYFADVPNTHWAISAVNFASSRELFNGMGSVDTFAPTAPMTRAMMTTVLWRLAERPDVAIVDLFDDVVHNSYYEQAAAWGLTTGVVKGTDIGFEPETPITRETLATLLYRAAGSPAVVDEMPRRFSDGDKVAAWAQTAMIWCIENNIVTGYPNSTLGPQNQASRAEVATMLQRFVDSQI